MSNNSKNDTWLHLFLWLLRVNPVGQAMSFPEVLCKFPSENTVGEPQCFRSFGSVLYEFVHKVFDVVYILSCEITGRKKTSSHWLEDTAQKILIARRFITDLPCHIEVDNFHLATPRVPEMGMAVVKSSPKVWKVSKIFHFKRTETHFSIEWHMTRKKQNNKTKEKKKKQTASVCVVKWLQTWFVDILLADKRIHLRIKCTYGTFICQTIPDKWNFPLDYKYRTAVKT